MKSSDGTTQGAPCTSAFNPERTTAFFCPSMRAVTVETTMITVAIIAVPAYTLAELPPGHIPPSFGAAQLATPDVIAAIGPNARCRKRFPYHVSEWRPDAMVQAVMDGQQPNGDPV
eukprot:GHVU01146153.1.p1 GENE.GHVU01146153.1~~GHVU01146153.1.p1  ORF type:complete len:116 (+),score=6.59 GHVU01146153.1:412-759(+)